jgi:hypothetical protein
MDGDNHRYPGLLSGGFSGRPFPAGPPVSDPFKKKTEHQGGLKAYKKDAMAVAENIVQDQDSSGIIRFRDTGINDYN